MKSGGSQTRCPNLFCSDLVRLVRFADDFIITSRTKERLEEEVRPLIAEFLNPRGLKLSESKTRITPIEEGFDFLGKHFQKHGGKLLIKPSRRNVQTFLAEIKTTFKENLHVPVERLLRSEEHTSELQSLRHLVCRLLLEKKNKNT